MAQERVAQAPPAKDQTAVDAAKTVKEGETARRTGGANPDTPQGSGDSPKPHGDPLKPVLEK